jgi:CHAT domain-containing protein
VTGASPDRSHLVVAGPSELAVAEILAATRRRPADAAGGLVVLSACVTDLTVSDYDEALTLASAFLTAGPVSVVASRWPVDDEATACLMAMVHHLRTTRGLPGREALRAAQAWMLDPAPEPPEALGELYPARPGVLAEPAVWAAFAHHGV